MCVLFSCADGAEHHVWLRDAAAGGAFGRSGRLHHRLPGEDRVVGQEQPAAGGRSDGRAAAAQGNIADRRTASQTSQTSLSLSFSFIIIKGYMNQKTIRAVRTNHRRQYVQ